jgi:hypothetical protein
MHRSGTSALTGVLGLVGAGLPAHLMPATPANPRGYFESQLLFELHEEIFQEAGVEWHDLLPPSADWFRSIHAARWVDRLAKAVLEEYGDAPLWVLKDPRMCRLVPLWASVFARLRVEPSYVLTVRHPFEVAASLAREHRMDERKAVLLWLDHVLRAERDTRGCRRTIVAYDHLLRDWRTTLGRIGSALDLPYPRLSRRTEAEVDAFLSRALHHHVADRDAIADRGDAVGWVKAAWDWATAASAGESVPTDPLDEAGEALAVAERAFGPLLAAAELERSTTAADVARLTAALEDARTQVKSNAGELARLGDELRGAQSQIALRGQDMETLRAELEQRQHHLARVIEWVKVLLQWAAQVTVGRPAPGPSLSVVFQALDTAEPAAIPAVATRALQVVVDAAESAGLRERLAERDTALGAARAETKERGAALAAAHDHVSALETKLAERTRVKDRLDRESARMRAELEVAREERKRIEHEVERSHAESAATVERLRAQLAGLERELARSRESLGNAARNGEALGEELARARAEIADRDLYAQQLKERLAAVDRSLVWRLGRPLRAVASLLRR